MSRIEVRDRLRGYLLDRADEDDRVVGAAEVGSLTAGPGDHWSDLDLTLAVSDQAALAGVLQDWTDDLVHRFEAAPALDLTRNETIYRVFFLADCVQLDLSVTPSPVIPATSTRFKLIFGQSEQQPVITPTGAELLGWVLLWAWSARVSIERGRLWQAEYCLAGARNSALEMACVRLGLPTSYAKGIDRLPDEVKRDFELALPRSLDQATLRGALEALVGAAGREGDKHSNISPIVRKRLDEVLAAR